MQAVAQHPFIMFLCLLAPLFLAQRSARVFPKNSLLTFLFTFVEGLSRAHPVPGGSAARRAWLGQAAVLTFVAFGVLSLYALVSKRDFSAWGSFFIVGLFVLIVASIINIFVAQRGGRMWIAAIGVLIFSGLLVFDTWRCCARASMARTTMCSPPCRSISIS